MINCNLRVLNLPITAERRLFERDGGKFSPINRGEKAN